jgi:hypothetical protein
LPGRELDVPSFVGGGRVGSVRFGMCCVVLCWWEICDALSIQCLFNSLVI